MGTAVEEYQQIFHKNKRYASDFYQASSNVECFLLCIFIFRICFHGTALVFVDVLPCPRIFLFTFLPCFLPSTDIDEFIREALPCRNLRSLLLCLFIAKVFNLSFEKYYFRIIFFPCSRMKFSYKYNFNAVTKTLFICIYEDKY